MNDDLRTRRIEYETAGLDVADVAADPLVQWRRWYDDASAAGITEPNAMTVATVGFDGNPDARVVLARGADDRSVVFFTNYGSVKSRQLERHPHAAAVFAWLELHRQARLRGRVERVDDHESDDYFASRPRESQLAAWASPQSDVLTDREELERRFADCARAIRRRRRAAAAVLGWLAADRRVRRVLAGPAEPAARPRQLSP